MNLPPALSFACRLIRRPQAWASFTALWVNLKQLQEISKPDGRPLLRTMRGRWLVLGQQVSMEMGQFQRDLGLDAGNPNWTEPPPTTRP